MYFLVNASPPKPLEVATSNFADALVRSIRVFAMVYHRLKSSYVCASYLFVLRTVFPSVLDSARKCISDEMDKHYGVR